MTKDIDLIHLQNIVDQPMQTVDRFRCRGCNKPFMSMLDAYSCDCQIVRGKKAIWPTGKKKIELKSKKKEIPKVTW